MVAPVPVPCHLPQNQPLFELRCSNNVVRVHSCADSCALLVNLLQYVTSSGDLHPPPRPPSPTEIAGQKVQVRPGRTGYQSSARPSLYTYTRPGLQEPWCSPLPLVLTPAPSLSRPSFQRALPPCPHAYQWRQPSSTSET